MSNPPKAKKQKHQADIVFCIDVTKSMQNCIDNINAHIQQFVEGLQKESSIDYRLGLLGFRNRHDESVIPTEFNRKCRPCDEPWVIKQFTKDIAEFKRWLIENDMQADGGGYSSDAESTLDALYIAVNELKWREGRTHRAIVLFTDEDSQPTLSKITYKRPDNTIGRVIQDISTQMKHGIIYLVAPDKPIYEELEQKCETASRTFIRKVVRDEDEGLRNVDFSKLLNSIGNAVSASIPTIINES